MNWVVLALGSWVIIDGIGSMIVYRYQMLHEHAVRIIRTLCGISLVVYSHLFL